MLTNERMISDKSPQQTEQQTDVVDQSAPNKPITKTKQLFEKRHHNALEQHFVKQLSEPAHAERRSRSKLLKSINNQHFSQDEVAGTSNSSSSNSNSRPSTADLIGCSSSKGAGPAIAAAAAAAAATANSTGPKAHDDSESSFIRNIANRLKAARNLIRTSESSNYSSTRSQSVSSDRHYSVNESKRRQHSLDANAERLSNHCVTPSRAVSTSPGSKPNIDLSNEASPKMDQKSKTLRCIKLRAMSTAPGGNRMAASSISSSHGNLESICKTAPTTRKQLLDPAARKKKEKEKVQAVKSSECAKAESPIYKRVETFDNCLAFRAADRASSVPPVPTAAMTSTSSSMSNPTPVLPPATTTASSSETPSQKTARSDSVGNREVQAEDSAAAAAAKEPSQPETVERKMPGPEEKSVRPEIAEKKQAIRTESNEILKQQLDTVLRTMMAEFECFAVAGAPTEQLQKKQHQQGRSDSSDRLVTPTPSHNALAQSRSHDSQAVVECVSPSSRTPSSQNLPFTPVFMRQFASASSSVSASVSGAVTPLSPAPPKPVHSTESFGTTVAPRDKPSPTPTPTPKEVRSEKRESVFSQRCDSLEAPSSGNQLIPTNHSIFKQPSNTAMPICRLTVTQLHSYRKMAFVNLSSLLEIYCPNLKLRSSDTWSLFRLRRKKDATALSTPANTIVAISPPPKLNSASLKNACHTMFGVPLEILQMRLQQSLPICILEAMRFLERETREKDPNTVNASSTINEGSVCCSDVVGIFRKSGNRKNVEELRRLMEMEVESDKPRASIFDLLNITTFTVYDVADCVKQFFRELPECLLTQKISEALIAVYESVPEDARLDVLRYGVLLLPDANREVLLTLLYFLKTLSSSCKRHQMNASNLAVCFAPSLFYFPNSVMSTSGGTTSAGSLRRARRATGIPDMKELQKQKAAQLCLTDLISKCENLFVVDIRSSRPQRSVSNVFERTAGTKEGKFASESASVGNPSQTPSMRQRCNTGVSMRKESSEKENDQDDSYSVTSLNAEKRNRILRLSSSSAHTHTLYRSMTEPFAKSCTTLIDNHLSTIVKEYRTEKQRKKRGWVTVTLPPGIIRQATSANSDNFFTGDASPTLAYKKLTDSDSEQESDLLLWRSAIVIDEPFEALYSTLVHENEWNSVVSNWQTIVQLDSSCDVVKFRKNDAFCGGRPDENSQLTNYKDYCIVRYLMHSTAQAKQASGSLGNIKKDIAVYLCTSVNENLLYEPVCPSYCENQVAWVFERCFVLEPLSTQNPNQQRTLVTLFWREDVRGKTADWYARFWPQQCYLELLRLKQYLIKRSNALSRSNLHV